MMGALTYLGLPLLTKELIEQAARPRTYIIRVVYAALLFLAGFAFYYSLANDYGFNALAMLGRGRQLFEMVLMVQFAGVYLFMPAMTCSVLTVEKERGSLGLLLLTRLGPLAILLEKLLGRMIPMFSFLLLSVPLLVIAYSLGGISQKFLWSGIWFLSITTLQVGTLALLCSAFFRTTVGAFMATYLLGIVMLFGLPMLDEVLGLNLATAFATLAPRPTGPMMWNSAYRWVPFAFVGPAIFETTSRSNASVTELILASTPILMLSTVMFLMARLFIVRRAFVPSGNFFLKVLKKIDAFFTKLNDNRWTKGRVLLADSVPLETITQPVAWRETTKSTLGAFRYLVRLFIVMEAPVATLGLLLLAINGSHEPLTFLLFLLWIVIVLIIAVKSATLVTGERSHETLDVLLTTPMRSSEIARQKFRGVTRLIWVLSVPLLTCILLKASILQVGGSYSYSYGGRVDWVLYTICAVLQVFIYLPLVAWLGMFIGLRTKNQSRAIFVTLAVLVAWCVLPIFSFVMLFESMGWYTGRGSLQCWLLTSPATIIPFNEFFDLRHFEYEWFAVMLNFFLYGFLWLLIRGMALTNLDRRLGRASEGGLG